MSEMALTADHLIVVGRGRLVADEPVTTFISRAATRAVHVRTPQIEQMVNAVRAAGAGVTVEPDGLLVVTDLTAPQIGDLAADNLIRVHELTPQQASLEEAFMELTADDLEYHGSTA
jgi:ABC-2 type transport system ATP-binding protein